MDNQTYQWLTLYLTGKPSATDWASIMQQAVTYAQLVQQHSGNTRLTEALRTLDPAFTDQHQSWAEQVDHHIIPWYSDHYPNPLKQIANPPPFLFARGKLALLDQPQIAIVGSRKASHAGIATTTQFANQLAEAGLVITSGLALGIDAAAHRAALEQQHPTIAVLPAGLDTIYPRRHHQLAQAICQHGCLLSEMPLNTTVKPYLFPRRNRLISGLSLGTLVIEAAAKSGSLITARLAAEQGREVFAVPGAIQNQQASGCHQLIQQGAKLVTQIDDILEEFPTLHTDPTTPEPSPDAHPLLAHIDFAATNFDTILYRSKLTACELSAMLSLLEIQGHIRTCPGGFMRN